MAYLIRTLRRACVSGTLASVTSTAALTLLAWSEGKGALQPVNATSHWLKGEQAATVRSADFVHTGTGYVTHHAATLFWAVLFEFWTDARGHRTALPVLGDAALVSVVAVAADYLATPKRFTPGWEFVLSARSMALAYAAMAAGLAAGAILTGRTDISSVPPAKISSGQDGSRS